MEFIGSTVTKSESFTISLIVFALYVSVFKWGYIVFYGITALMVLCVGPKMPINVFKKYFAFYLIPRIMILVHAFLCVFVNHQSFYIFRSINCFLYASMCIIFAYCLYVLHGSRAIRIIFIGASGYYALRLVGAFISVGPIKFIINLFVPGSVVLAEWLEAHDIGLSFGSILLYYLFYEKHQCKDRKMYIIISGMILYLCWKRIAIAAFLACVLFIAIFHRTIDRKNRWTILWGIIGVTICFMFVYLVKSRIMIEWFYAKGINTQGRNSLYRFIESYYQFSPCFFGRGDGYTGKLLTDLVRSGNGIGSIVALHSDILRAFVEYGFWGSILWYSYYLIFLPGKFKRKNRKMGGLLLVMAMYLFIIYLTDNASGYMLCQILYMLLPLQYVFTENKVVENGH